MLLKRFTDFILKNPINLLGTAFVITYIPLLGSIGTWMIGFITLVRGEKEGLNVLIAASLPLGIAMLFELTGSGDSIGALDLNIAFLLINILTYVYTILLRQYGSWSLLLQVAALIGIMTVGCAYIFIPDLQGWWQAHLTHFFDYCIKAFGDVTKTNNLVASDETALERAKAAIMVAGNLKSHVPMLTPIATGFVTASVVFWALLQSVFARWWQAAIYNPGAITKEIGNIRLSYVAGILTMMIGLLSLTHNSAVGNMWMILFFMYLLAGLSVMNTLVDQYIVSQKYNFLWVWNILITIAVLIIPTGIGVECIALLGFADTFLDCRGWKTRKHS